jgi:exosortase E/protease (VPEID-CTERM system)
MPQPSPHSTTASLSWLSPFAPPLRWILLAGLLAAEVLLLSFRFDTKFLSASDSWAAQLAGDLPVYLRIGFAALAAFVVIVYPRLPSLAREAKHAALNHAWLLWLPLQLAVYWGFLQATAAVFMLAEGKEAPPGALLAGWALLGLGVFGTWLLTAAPFRYWLDFLRRERAALAVALAAGAAAWGLGEIAHQFWKPLATATFAVSKTFLKLLYPHVLYDTEDYSLGTPDFIVQVAPQCSGYEGIGLVIVFLALYLWIFRDTLRFPHSLLLFPIGAFAIWLANSVRISTLIAIGTSYSKEVAMGGFHSQAGWIAFSAIALGLIVLTRRFRLFSRLPDVQAAAAADLGPADATASALLVPLLALMAGVMLTSAFASRGFDGLYPLRPILTAAAIWHYRRVYRGWDWSFTWTGPAVGVLVFALWMWLEPAGDNSVLGGALEELPPATRGAWLAFRVVGSVILVPIAEELAFRGYLMRRLVSAEFETVPMGRLTWVAFIGSSLAFGLVHGRWLAGTLAGMAYALAVYRRGKLGDAVVAHMTTNGLIAIAAIAFGQWSLWS